jgi:arylsulfatase A-like enzyme
VTVKNPVGVIMRALLIVFPFFILLASCQPAETKIEKPNIVFLLVDDLGWKDLQSYGSSFYDTPHTNKLAASAMRFTNAYAACPVCSPTRASILAGKYPARINTTDFFGGPQPPADPKKSKGRGRNRPLFPARYVNRLPLEEVTLAEALKENGYATFFAGKWHLGRKGYYPTDQGFDVNMAGWQTGWPYTGKRYFSPYDNPNMKNGPDGEHLPDRLASETVKFMKANQDKPFLAYLSFYSVHTPLMSRKDLKAKYDKKKLKTKENTWGVEGARNVREVQNHSVYAGMVEAMDQAVGKVLSAIDDLGLRRKTIVVFMSDNGGLSTSEGSPTSNYPLRAGKGWLYEGGIREPMMVRWPGVTARGSVCDVPVTSTDFYPSLLEMAGLPMKNKQHVDGVSFVPLLKGAKVWKRAPLYWHYPHYGNQGGQPGAAIRQGDYKLIEFFAEGKLELYNLKKDIGEKNDLSAQQPAKVKELKALLHAWQKSVDARMPTKNPNYVKK